MTKAAAIITTIAINGGLNSTGNLDGGDVVDVDWSVFVDCKKAAAVGDGEGDGNGNHRESWLWWSGDGAEAMWRLRMVKLELED